MLTRRVIPCLDCRDGRVVKGIQFGNLRDCGAPEDHARQYLQQGADELVLLDVAATVNGRANQLETIRRVRDELSIPLTVGGGVRDLESAGALLLAGADKISVNSAAVNSPELLDRLAAEFGAQCIVLAVDAREQAVGNWRVLTHSGGRDSGLDAVAWCVEAARRGIGEILLTSWDRDGTRSGYDLKLIGAVSDSVTVPVIASGGAREPMDLVRAIEAGADAVLAASMFHSGEYRIADVKRVLAESGWSVRQC